MKYWVQFLQYAVYPPSDAGIKLIDATGDLGVYILDGRNSQETMRRDALRRAQRLAHWKKYPAFQLVQGPRLFEESQRGPVNVINYPAGV